MVEKKGCKKKEMITVEKGNHREVRTRYASGQNCKILQEVYVCILSAEEEKKAEESLSSNENREMCKMWETVQNFVEKHHLNKAIAVWEMNLFKDNAMSHFREILKKRQKQVSLDRFLVKLAQKERFHWANR